MGEHIEKINSILYRNYGLPSHCAEIVMQNFKGLNGGTGKSQEDFCNTLKGGLSPFFYYQKYKFKQGR